MTKLKPCPFCGKPVIIYYSSATKDYYAVHQDEKNSDCILLMPIGISHNRYLTCLNDAYLAWNRMADNAEVH